MKILLRVSLCAAFALIALGAPSDPPLEQEFIPGTAVHFRSDHFTGAAYLRLAAEGTYEITAVEHMGQTPTDRGRWRTERSQLFLHSDLRVLDVTTPSFRVYLGSGKDVALLPRLKAKVLDLHTRLKGRPVYPKDVTSLDVSEGQGKRYHASASVLLNVEVEWGIGHADAASLLQLATAIDGYLAHPERQRVFPYRCYSYRGHTFLVPLSPGVAAVESTPASVRGHIDENEGGPPPYVFLLVPASVYEKGVGRGYPFKFYPELNPPE